MNKKAIKITIGITAVAVIIIGLTVISNKMSGVNYEYEPVSIDEIQQIRECVTKVTGTQKLDIEELVKDQILFSDVYRYCLKTVDDVEVVLKKLAK